MRGKILELLFARRYFYFMSHLVVSLAIFFTLSIIFSITFSFCSECWMLLLFFMSLKFLFWSSPYQFLYFRFFSLTRQILFSIVSPNIQLKIFTEDRKCINKSQSLPKEKTTIFYSKYYCFKIFCTCMINYNSLFWSPTDERKEEKKRML